MEEMLVFLCNVVTRPGENDAHSIINEINEHAKAVMTSFYPEQSERTMEQRTGSLGNKLRAIVSRVMM